MTDNTAPATLAPANSRAYYRAKPAFIVMRWVIGGLLKLLFRIEGQGLHHLPPQGGYILAGNHLSWIDPFLMMVLAPASPRIYFIAAEEEVYHPAWRKFITTNVGGVIPIDRAKSGNLRELSRRIDQVIKGGGVLGIFPEGDVSAVETGKILPLKRGMAFFAVYSAVPVVPVVFRGTKELWIGKRISMTVGAPISVSTAGKEAVLQLTAATEAALLEIMPPPLTQNPKSRQFMKKFFTELFTQEEREHPTPD